MRAFIRYNGKNSSQRVRKSTVASYLLTLIQGVFKLLPFSLSSKLGVLVVRIFLIFVPRANKVALINLTQAFPDITEAQKKEILRKHIQELGVMLSTILRGEHLSADWQKKHVEIDSQETFKRLINCHGATGAMLATAHLGNFEMLLHYVTLVGSKINFISRALKPQWLQDWWMSQRSKSGSKGIEREGAVRGVLSALRKKEIVAVLFDQNVTREHAAFVPLFGRKCATTKIIPLMLKKNNVPLFFITVKRVDNSYRARISEVQYSDLVNLEDIEEFSVQLLTKLHLELEDRIREFPEGWFWFHRRWKTAPLGEKEDFYKK